MGTKWNARPDVAFDLRSLFDPQVRTDGSEDVTIDRRTESRWDGRLFIVVQAGVITDGLQSVAFTESTNDNTDDETGLADPYTEVDEAEEISLGPSDSSETVCFVVTPTKRFVKATLTVAGSTEGGCVGVMLGSRPAR